jgi:hypothetical protein
MSMGMSMDMGIGMGHVFSTDMGIGVGIGMGIGMDMGIDMGIGMGHAGLRRTSACLHRCIIANWGPIGVHRCSSTHGGFRFLVHIGQPSQLEV